MQLIRILALLLCLPATPVHAALFFVPDNGDTIVGQLQFTHTRSDETLLDIARRYDIGFNEIASANPNVDPWLPGDNTQLLIPTRFILPDKPWQGIIINLAEMRLYYFPEAGDTQRALVFTFPIGIGRASWPTPLGNYKVVEKIKAPVWTIPDSVIQEALDEGITLPKVVPAGEDNPLGDYALLLDEPGYLIHGTNKPLSVGRRVSHGCIRLYPEDIEQLIQRVPRGAPVRIEEDAIKIGVENDVLFIEADTYKKSEMAQSQITTEAKQKIDSYSENALSTQTWDTMRAIITGNRGIPVPVADLTRRKQVTNPLSLIYEIRDGKVTENIRYTVVDITTRADQLNCPATKHCLQLGPFNSPAMYRAVMHLIRFGYGLNAQ